MLCIRIHWIWIRTQHFKWIRIRIRIWIWSSSKSGSKVFDDKNLRKKYSWIFFCFFFWSKITIYLSLDLHKGRPSYRRSLRPSKEDIQHFKRWNLLTFYFSGSLLPSGIRIRIRTRTQGPHWIRIHNTAVKIKTHIVCFNILYLCRKCHSWNFFQINCTSGLP